MKKITTLIFTFIITLNLFAFEITPDYFGQRLDNGGAFQEYTISNKTNHTVRYRFSALPSKIKEKSMDKWVVFQPRYMTIKPGESRCLKIFANSPLNTQVGEYAFYTYIESITIPDFVFDKEKTALVAGTQFGVNIAIQMFAWVGDLPPKVDLYNYKVYKKNGRLHIKGTLKNLTKKRFVQYRVTAYGKNSSQVIDGGFIFIDQSKNFDTLLSDNFSSITDLDKIEVIEFPSQNILKIVKF